MVEDEQEPVREIVEEVQEVELCWRWGWLRRKLRR